MHDFRKLRVWQDAIEFVVDIYHTTRQFPAEEKFNLTSQLNRAAVSIPSNISEGAGRGSNAEFIQFLNYASGSCSEAFTQLLIANRLGYVSGEEFEKTDARLNGIHRMIHKLISNLRNTPPA